jgi:DinB superfamily
MKEVNVSDDRLRILLGQLDDAWEILDARLTGRQMFSSDSSSSELTLTDDEYFWEAAPNCWSLRPRGQSASREPVGTGDWLLDLDSRPLQPAPFTTIAWRMCHICVSPLVRYDYTFGSHSLSLETITWPATARDAFDFVKASHMQWRTALEGLTTSELDQVGRCQNPDGLDQQVRLIDLLGWTNVEFVHHAAEIACVRDLYTASRDSA